MSAFIVNIAARYSFVIFLLNILPLTAVAPVNLTSEDTKVIVYRLCLIDGFEGSKYYTTNRFDITKVASVETY
jgi:hypothetical protein